MNTIWDNNNAIGEILKNQNAPVSGRIIGQFPLVPDNFLFKGYGVNFKWSRTLGGDTNVPLIDIISDPTSGQAGLLSAINTDIAIFGKGHALVNADLLFVGYQNATMTGSDFSSIINIPAMRFDCQPFHLIDPLSTLNQAFVRLCNRISVGANVELNGSINVSLSDSFFTGYDFSQISGNVETFTHFHGLLFLMQKA
jgi:hypothetical protein